MIFLRVLNYSVNLQLLWVPLENFYIILVYYILNHIDYINIKQSESGLRAYMGVLLFCCVYSDTLRFQYNQLS